MVNGIQLPTGGQDYGPGSPKQRAYLVLHGRAELLLEMGLFLHPLSSGLAVLFRQVVKGTL